ncbi:MAG: ferritin-like domain-containing protein [Deltaproteobacteria bacterium]|nr:ferritin-like domain-containing protein [Deltaproteobacteria bacterium]
MGRLDLTRGAAAHAIALPTLALSDDERALAQRTWLGRMKSEHVSARVFAALVPQLMKAGIHDERLSAVVAMIEEELVHARLCAAAVVALGGRPVVELEPGDLPDVPAHEDAASPLEALLRNVLSICCLSETIAVAQITSEREVMQDGPLGPMITRILADEVGHARFGWRLLEELAPELDEATRMRLDRYLGVALRALAEHQLRTGGDPRFRSRPDLMALGVADALVLRVAAIETIERVIVPGLEALGFRARAAWEPVRPALWPEP